MSNMASEASCSATAFLKTAPRPHVERVAKTLMAVPQNDPRHEKDRHDAFVFLVDQGYLEADADAERVRGFLDAIISARS